MKNYQAALNRLVDHLETWDYRDDTLSKYDAEKDKTVIQELVNRAMPRKPFYDAKVKRHRCIECGCVIQPTGYCPECGQAINWYDYDQTARTCNRTCENCKFNKGDRCALFDE